MAPTISLCVIARNEARAIGRCLESVRPWVDEMVVVDTGSTDGTQDLARERGARVVEWAWRDDFAAARNESLRHATGDWILCLDADETLDAGAGEALRAACGGAPADVAGWLVKIVCPRDGDGGLVRLNWFPRLFRNLAGVRFEGVIHEQVIGSLAGHGRIERSTVTVLHAGYTLSAEAMAAKTQRNLRMLEGQLREDPTYAPGWFQIAETYVMLGRGDDAVEAYRRCLALLRTSRLTLPPSVAAVAMQNLGAALLARGDRAEGIDAIETALQISPELAPAHVHLGMAAFADERWAEAEEHFATALGIIQRADDSGEYEASPWLVHFLRGCARGRQDKRAEAIASFEAALALNPEHRESLWLLALCLANEGQWARSLEPLDRLGALGRDDFPYHAQRAQAYQALRQHEAAARAAERALAFEPASAPVLAIAAESQARAGQALRAAGYYERLIAQAGESLGALLALAQCCESAGDRERMMQAYERAVARWPESPEVLFALGSACLRAGDLAVAEQCLAEAVDREPNRPDFRINHALCLLKRGETARAGEALGVIATRWPHLEQVHQLRQLIGRFEAAAGVA